MKSYSILNALGKKISENILKFSENRIWHFMQIVSQEDILHELSNLFSDKNISNLLSSELPGGCLKLMLC